MIILIISLLSAMISATFQCNLGINPFQASTGGALISNFYMTIKVLSNDNIIVAYNPTTLPYGRIRIFDRSGTPITSDYGFSLLTKLQITTLQGRFVVAYRNTTTNKPYFQIFSNSGEPVTDIQVVSTAATTNYEPEISTLKNDTFVLCFQSSLGNILCCLFDEAGAAISVCQIRSLATVNLGYRFRVVGLAGGGYMLGYITGSAYIYGIAYSSSGIPYSSEFQLQSSSAVLNNIYSMAALSNGGFVISYFKSSNYYIAGWFPNATVMFTEKIINSTSSPVNPTIIPFSTGGFFISYTKNNMAVRGQIFYSNGTAAIRDKIIFNGNQESGHAGSSIDDDTVVIGSLYSQKIMAIIVNFSNCDLFDPFTINLTATNTSLINTQNITQILNETMNFNNSSNVFNGSNLPNQTINTSNTSNWWNYTNFSNNTNSPNFTTTNNSNMTPPDSSSETFVSNSTKYDPPAALKVLSAGAATAMGTAVGTSFASGANPTLMWGFMSFLQQFFYLLFLNLDIPENLRSFLSIFSFANLDFIPNIFDEIPVPNISSPLKFYENGFTGLLLYTIGSNLQLWVIVGLLTAILSFNRRNTYLSMRIRLSLVKSFPVRMWVDSLPPFLIASCLQLNSFDIGEIFTQVSQFFGIALLFLILLTPFYFWRTIKKNNDTLILHSLFEDFDSTDRKKKYFPVYDIIKKIAAAITIVYCYEYPIHQVLGLAIINVYYFGCLFNLQPRKSKYENYYYLTLEFLSVLIHLSLSFFHYDMDKDKKESLGYLIIAVIITCVLLSTGPMIFNQIKTIASLLRRKPYKKVKKKTRLKSLKVGFYKQVQEHSLSSDNENTHTNELTTVQESQIELVKKGPIVKFKDPAAIFMTSQINQGLENDDLEESFKISENDYNPPDKNNKDKLQPVRLVDRIIHAQKLGKSSVPDKNITYPENITDIDRAIISETIKIDDDFGNFKINTSKITQSPTKLKKLIDSYLS